MVDKCTHLDKEKKVTLKKLFSIFSELFSGKLGKVPGEKVRLKVKLDVFPFHSRAYTIPKAFETLAKKEVQDLVNIGALVKDVWTAYTSPSFLDIKKTVEFGLSVIYVN